jgi:hypothetical protein
MGASEAPYQIQFSETKEYSLNKKYFLNEEILPKQAA